MSDLIVTLEDFKASARIFFFGYSQAPHANTPMVAIEDGDCVAVLMPEGMWNEFRLPGPEPTPMDTIPWDAFIENLEIYYTRITWEGVFPTVLRVVVGQRTAVLVAEEEIMVIQSLRQQQ